MNGNLADNNVILQNGARTRRQERLYVKVEVGGRNSLRKADIFNRKERREWRERFGFYHRGHGEHGGKKRLNEKAEGLKTES